MSAEKKAELKQHDQHKIEDAGAVAEKASDSMAPTGRLIFLTTNTLDEIKSIVDLVKTSFN